MVMEAVGGGDGGGAAPGTFKVTGQSAAIQVYGGSQVRDAVTITIQELLYGIYFGFTIPRTEWNNDGTQYWAELYTGWVQYLAARDGTLGISYTQDVNQGGNLTDFLLVTVGTPDGLQSVDVLVELAQANSEATFGKLNAAEATLAATAALT